MSQRERDRLKVMSLVLEGKRTQGEAARLLGLTDRSIRRIQRRLEQEGDGGIVHRLRGRPSNRAAGDDLRRQVIARYRERYGGFGPTLAAEKLRAEGLPVSDETLRIWLLEEGLWERKRRRDQHRQRRPRRECYGELTQADGSHPDWLEGRGEKIVLVVMIDDATSRATARFYPGETTAAYMDLLGRYLRRHGRMNAMYVDRDSIFRAEKSDAYDDRPVLTQFSRALGELQIELILANSPQAKGRVERFHQTAQDRLVKELRLAGARTLEEANAVLEKVFLPWFNRRCTVKPGSRNDAHRPLHPSMNLAAILSIQEPRRVGNDYTIRLENQIYQILPPALPGLRRGRVIAEKRLDGSLHLRLGKQYLKFRAWSQPKASGALPPNPRSLPRARTPAEVRNEQGQAAATARPSAVRPTAGRSGRTPAEPCPPNGQPSVLPATGTRLRPDQAWMRTFRLPGSRTPKPDIPTLAK
jgi:transposase